MMVQADDWTNVFPPGSVTCFLCKANIKYEHNERASFFDHVKLEHKSLFHHKLLLAINFMEKEAVEKIIKAFDESVKNGESALGDGNNSTLAANDSGISDSGDMSFGDLINYISDETVGEKAKESDKDEAKESDKDEAKESNKDDSVFKCDYCPKTYTSKKSHYNHVYYTHNNPTKKRKSVSTDTTPSSKKAKSESSKIEAQPEDNSQHKIQVLIKKSKYFRANPKEISTKCNPQLHTGNKFPKVDENLPRGWKVREHKNADDEVETHYLAPDGRVMKSKEAVQEYMKITKKYSADEIEKVCRKEKENPAPPVFVVPNVDIKKERMENNSTEGHTKGKMKRSNIKFKIKKEKPIKNNKKGNKVNETKLNKQNKNTEKEFKKSNVEIKKERMEIGEEQKQEKDNSTVNVKVERASSRTRTPNKKERLEKKIKKIKNTNPININIKKEMFESVEKGEELSKLTKKKLLKGNEGKKLKAILSKNPEFSAAQIKKELTGSGGEGGEEFSAKVTRRNGIKFLKMSGRKKSKPSKAKKSGEPKKPPGQSKKGAEECPICHKMRTNMKTHTEDMHTQGNFPCSVCKKVFTSRNKMSSHWSRVCNPNRQKRKSI